MQPSLYTDALSLIIFIKKEEGMQKLMGINKPSKDKVT